MYSFPQNIYRAQVFSYECSIRLETVIKIFLEIAFSGRKLSDTKYVEQHFGRISEQCVNARTERSARIVSSTPF